MSPTITDDGETLFRNSYCCPNCDHEWDDEWECQVDEDCPACGTRSISPYWSDDAEGSADPSKDALDSARESQRDLTLQMLRAGRRTESLTAALQGMWAFGSRMVERHGMDGDDTMTDEDHALWQEAGGAANAAIGGAGRAPDGPPAPDVRHALDVALGWMEGLQEAAPGEGIRLGVETVREALAHLGGSKL